MDHAPAWLKLAMDVPVTAPLGPMGPLIRRLYGPAAREQQGRPMADIDTEIQQLVEQGLMEGLFVSLKGLSEAEDASLSFTAKWWMKEVRELCYDAEDHFDEVTTLHYSGAGIAARILLCICTKLTSPPLHIASDISEIMARVKDASKRQENFLLAPNPKITTAAGSAGEAAGVPTDMTGGRRRWCRRMDDLVKLLAFDDESQKQLKVVSIFGLAGVGKTTAARALFDEFGGDFQCRAFLRVSRNPDIRRLLTSILSQIKAPQVRGFPDAQILTASRRRRVTRLPPQYPEQIDYVFPEPDAASSLAAAPRHVPWLLVASAARRTFSSLEAAPASARRQRRYYVQLLLIAAAAACHRPPRRSLVALLLLAMAFMAAPDRASPSWVPDRAELAKMARQIFGRRARASWDRASRAGSASTLKYHPHPPTPRGCRLLSAAPKKHRRQRRSRGGYCRATPAVAFAIASDHDGMKIAKRAVPGRPDGPGIEAQARHRRSFEQARPDLMCAGPGANGPSPPSFRAFQKSPPLDGHLYHQAPGRK
ncbi:hypothetical protein BRADI_4g12733v3 [Brachypodium distachyon]|uniref:NB-ARC domain-containing protein n=1 Tax=Brachypodium distachyon TaxID=15368 RepID=A0A2K2CMC8_BRADI|nr:hypothetical protein BRADI_4g12733v3 [Brachypodium distachyon]